MCFMDPLQLHGAINGLTISSLSKQILHMLGAAAVTVMADTSDFTEPLVLLLELSVLVLLLMVEAVGEAEVVHVMLANAAPQVLVEGLPLIDVISVVRPALWSVLRDSVNDADEGASSVSKGS